ncbi:hypothetical protein [Govanella unica]|uniref:Uncharacterized protein n=1 Tax=Govanella unica TaxID=2975056 RepID=A0A9X3Z5T7_9PROT|nr:hypothetical protein [Govania unica]MDA5192480.1 hypothetical protein [Govania unica]
MQKTHDGMKAQSMLKTLEDESGIDPGCYFATVADSLLGRFGERAIAIAAEAVQKMRNLGDESGREMWEGVSAEIWSRLADHLDFTPEPMALVH